MRRRSSRGADLGKKMPKSCPNSGLSLIPIEYRVSSLELDPRPKAEKQLKLSILLAMFWPQSPWWFSVATRRQRRDIKKYQNQPESSTSSLKWPAARYWGKFSALVAAKQPCATGRAAAISPISSSHQNAVDYSYCTFLAASYSCSTQSQ